MPERRPPIRRDRLTAAEAARVADVFTRHRQLLEAVARQNAPSHDDVQDIVQEVGLRVCRGLNGFRDEAEVTSWLFRVTVNTARSYYAQERRHLVAREALGQAEVLPATGDGPDRQLIASERIAALHDAVQRLRTPWRGVIRDDLQEQAVLPDRKRNATRYRARRRLRELLTDDPRLG